MPTVCGSGSRGRHQVLVGRDQDLRTDCHSRYAKSSATPVAGTAYDFAANACQAVWSSDAGQLPCPGSDGDWRGFVLKLTNPQLENGVVDSRQALLTFPQNTYNGYVLGIYPPYRVKSGDRFRSIVNCAYGATSCYVVFRLDYQTGTGPITTYWRSSRSTRASTTRPTWT